MATKRSAGNVLTDKELKKRYNTALASEICLDDESSLWLPSQVVAFNHQLGGGIPYGRILELYGEESTGKTLLAMDFGVCAQSLGGVIIWNDAEATFSPHWAKANGIDLTKTYIYTESAIESISDWQADMIVTMRSRLTNNEPILLVVDSTAALDCMENINTSQVDSRAEMGNRAKAIYTMLRRRNNFYAKYGVSVIYINQLRQKVGASKYEDPDTTPGGSAMKFYASQRIGLYKGKQIKDEFDERVGGMVYMRTKKNKVAPPRGRTEARVHFTEHENMLGYHRYAGLPDVLLKMGILKRKSARWYYKDKMIAQGDEKMLKVLDENDELRRKLITRSKINTTSRTRKQLQSLNKNLYPVKEAKKTKEDGPEE